MVIGIPRVFLFHKYGVFWQAYFKELGLDVVLSPESNSQILARSIELSIDECCLPSKLFLGHTDYLKDKCDCVLVPRIADSGRERRACVKYYGLYDITHNTFPSLKLLDYNIDYKRKDTTRLQFIKLAARLKRPLRALQAVRAGENAARTFRLRQRVVRDAALNSSHLKVFVASHSYNIHDKMIGAPIIKYLKRLGIEPVFSCEGDSIFTTSTNLSSSVYWAFNREILDSLSLLLPRINGVLFLSSFPCGADSLVNELTNRRLKNIPKLNLVIDELASDGGIETRLESFADILLANSAASGS